MMPFWLFATAFFLTVIGTYGMRKYALRSALLDVPGNRSLHQRPVARGGGAAIVAAFITVLILWDAFDQTVSFPPSLLAVFVSAVAMSVLGFCDDRMSLSARTRLVIQSAIAFIFLFALYEFSVSGAWLTAFYNLHFFFIAPIAFLFLLWMTNLYNFMDGSDGIAALQGLTTAVPTAFLLYAAGAGQLSYVALVLAGGCTGFLLWNWQPAKIFMGDVGSVFLGFSLAAFILWAPLFTPVSFAALLVLHGTFIVDATVTLLVRLSHGRKPHQAHRAHFYQRWIQDGKTHRLVALSYATVNLVWLFPFALWITTHERNSLINLVWVGLAWLPLVALALVKKAGHD